MEIIEDGHFVLLNTYKYYIYIFCYRAFSEIIKLNAYNNITKKI